MTDGLGARSSFAGLLGRDWMMIGGCAFFAFVLLVVRPFGDATENPEKELATEWNEGIAQLGISPVYPPEEDFYVGDILAVVSGSTKLPLLGRAVRLGHVDLRDDIVEEAAGRPVFADTIELKSNDEYRHQDDGERDPAPADKHVRLTIAAFPGVSIVHLAHAGSAAGVSLLGFGAMRDDTIVEELRIPVAETYGVTASRGAGRLRQWCADKAHALLCTDSFARHVLAYTVDPDLLHSVGGVYPTRIELQLVTRVFMTRTIEQRRRQTSARGVSAAARGSAASALAPRADDKAATPESRARDAVSAVEQTTADAAKSGAPAADVSTGEVGEIRLQQTFQRPVVFGFRSWNIEMQPEAPR